MTTAEKLQAIKDMEININEDFPSDYGFFELKICLYDDSCGDCWIKTLED